MNTTPLYDIQSQSVQTNNNTDDITRLGAPGSIGLGFLPSSRAQDVTFISRNNQTMVEYTPSQNREGLMGHTFPGFGNNDTSSKFMIDNRIPDDKIPKHQQNVKIAAYNKNISKLPKRNVDKVIIGIISNEIKKKISVVECTKPDRKGSQTINDPKMGVVPGNNVCATCRLPLGLCSGHFGLLKFNPVENPNKPGSRIESFIYHPMFIKDVEHVLTCVCHDCGSLRITKEQIIEQGLDLKSGFKRLKLIAEYCRDKLRDVQCTGPKSMAGEEGEIIKCRVSPIFDTSKNDRTNGNLMVKNAMEKGGKNMFDVRKAYKILSNISDEDKELLGFGTNTHPKDMILDSILVIPPAYRGASIAIPGSFSTDSLGNQYMNIIRVNNKLNDKDAYSKRSDILKDIYIEYSKLLNNDIKEDSGKYGQFTGILSKFRTKDGIFRDIALGKRVDFSARSVIGPNPDLSLVEVGVPMMWREYLTVPEPVTYFNKSKLIQLFNEGMVRSINQKGYDKRITASNKNKIKIRLGDTVNRWLMDGDFVILGRQPSIHKGSIAGLRVKLIPNVANIQLNPAYTSQFNADFDGDEMNLHVPQTAEARAEVMIVMALKHCLLDEQANTPMVGLIMSNISSAFIITMTNPVIQPGLMLAAKSMLTEKKQLATLDSRLRSESIRKYSGYGYISMIFPVRFTYSKNGVIIRNGIIVSGSLTKKHIGRGSNSIFQVAERDFGSEVAVKMMNDLSKILNRFLSWWGLSIGQESCSNSDDRINKMKESSLAILRDMVMMSGVTFDDPIEETKHRREMLAILEQPKNMTTELMASTFGVLNPLAIMINSGAKGGPFNAAQMKNMVGQTYKEGSIFPNTMTNNTRTLPVFEPNENSPEAFGFIPRSFSEGLRPQDTYFQASSTRDNLADTALKTADVGRISRETNFVMGDCITHYDGTVRNSNGKIVQMMYGGDGFNAAQLESIPMSGENVLMFANIPRIITRLNNKYGYSEFRKTNIPKSIVNELLDQRTIYKGPSSKKQIETLINEDNRKEVRDILNKYIDDVMNVETIITEYINNDALDDSVYSQIEYDSDKLRKDINFKYIKIAMDNELLDDETVYLNLDDKNAVDYWMDEFRLDEDNIYSLSDVNDGNKRVFDGQTLPFSDNMFDFISSLGFINRNISINNMINELKRILKIGGTVLIESYDVNGDIDKMLSDIDQMSMDYIMGKYEPEKYVNNMINREELKNIMADNFKEIESKYDVVDNRKYHAVYQLINK